LIFSTIGYYDHQDEIEDSIRESTKLMEEIGTPIE
jgi:hypothetical protein